MCRFNIYITIHNSHNVIEIDNYVILNTLHDFQFWEHVIFFYFFVAVFLGCTSTGRVGLCFLWFYVQELPKTQPAVVLVLKRLRRRGNGLKSHLIDWENLSIQLDSKHAKPNIGKHIQDQHYFNHTIS